MWQACSFLSVGMPVFEGGIPVFWGALTPKKREKVEVRLGVGRNDAIRQNAYFPDNQHLVSCHSTISREVQVILVFVKNKTQGFAGDPEVIEVRDDIF